MKDILSIREFISRRRANERLVLCTLVRKTGSSYRTVGAKKVISLNGESLGLLSGGCLEASIEKVARENYNQLPLVKIFDMLSDDDRLLGYQTGCQGAIEILFEKIETETDIDLLLPFGPTPRAAGVRVDLRPEFLGERVFVSESANPQKDFLIEPWIEPVELYLIGCGADAKSYVPLADTLGWTIKFLDYRRDLVEGGGFPEGSARHAPLSRLTEYIPSGPRVAVVLMTHNFESDLEILKGLNRHQIGYLGCLGPAQRFERLKVDLKSLHGIDLNPALEKVAFAPAGILTSGRSPEEIALSIVAQIQQRLVENTPAKTWTLILAAGESKRFGSAKALAKYGSETFLERALSAAKGFSGENIMVVTGAHHQSLVKELAGVRHSFNPIWAQGMATSITHGLREILSLDPTVAGVAILPVDQPLVSAEHLRELWSESTRAGRCALTASGEVYGPPAYIPKSYFHLARKISGDRGLKSVLSPSQIIAVESQIALADADTPAERDQLISL